MIIVDTGGLISEVDRGSRLHEATSSLLDDSIAERAKYAQATRDNGKPDHPFADAVVILLV